MCKECQAARINGKMVAMDNDGMDAILNIGKASLTAVASFKAVEIGTQHVEVLKSSKLISGLTKVGVAGITALMFPNVAYNPWGAGALIGVTVSGGNDLLEHAGINGFIQEPNYLNPNAANKTAQTETQKGANVSVQYS